MYYYAWQGCNSLSPGGPHTLSWLVTAPLSWLVSSCKTVRDMGRVERSAVPTRFLILQSIPVTAPPGTGGVQVTPSHEHAAVPLVHVKCLPDVNPLERDRRAVISSTAAVGCKRRQITRRPTYRLCTLMCSADSTALRLAVTACPAAVAPAPGSSDLARTQRRKRASAACCQH